MVPKTQIKTVNLKQEPRGATDNTAALQAMREAGLKAAASLGWLPRVSKSRIFATRCRNLEESFRTVSKNIDAEFKRNPGSEDLLWLRDNGHQLSSAQRGVTGELGSLTHVPHVSNAGEVMPRVLAVATCFVDQVGCSFSQGEFAAFCAAFEEITALEFREIGALVPALKLVLLERIAAQGIFLVKGVTSTSPVRITACIRSLEHVTQASWKDVLEPLIPFDTILRDDPAGAYASMDVESRNVYRESVSRIAQRSDQTELQVAAEALALARRPQQSQFSDPRRKLRHSHIGFYLVGEGTATLRQRVGFHPSLGDRVTGFLRRHPDEFLLLGIALLTLAITTSAVWLLTPASISLLVIVLSLLVLLLPSSQAAVQLMNYLTTNLLPTETLSKLDFSDGIPDDCMTLVAVPTLLFNEQQVHNLVAALEVRYLGNHDRNLHFALVSDLPDSYQPASEDHPLVAHCGDMINKLNAKYAGRDSGSFFFLHRHRVYNPREQGWMGWERKRGKLHDLNQLLRGQHDSFPIKVGDLSILPKVRFVITLDSDTELPRGSAHRLVGTLAHPLNQAITDPLNNLVVTGYGILQPRVGVSVQSSARSRLAAIFAGETGLDPYTRAVSDVYQDLYGEGIFAGKGIYEVDAMLGVLNHRFPRNALLSHDLIEGAYARAGLVTDVTVIEDYPSHYSAYNRRKHRWLRGDWQIVEWLTDRVPDESGARVPNPISLVSRWKILDNLRRSLVEPATFALLLIGWLVMPSPFLWTLAAICILFVPACFEFMFGLVRAMTGLHVRIARDAWNNLLAANSTVLLGLTLLAHQTILSLDAVVRAITRRMVTRRRLLEWETAAEAELGKSRTAIDRYLDWMLFGAIGLGLLIWLVRPKALWAALPILALWSGSKAVAVWLDACPVKPAPEITSGDRWLLRKSALHIWRYFAEFSIEEYNWLIPDNVEEKQRKVTATVSPTNVGLLLNARQVAAELGYLTVPELVNLTEATLATMVRLSQCRGHLLNWYDTRTLEPKSPLFVSSVDSGNLAASLWTLSRGLQDRLRKPLVSKTLATGAIDHVRTLCELRVLSKRALSQCERDFQSDDWLRLLLGLGETVATHARSGSKTTNADDVDWFLRQTHLRAQSVHALVEDYLPWKLPEFAKLEEELGITSELAADIPLQALPDSISALESRLSDRLQFARNGNGALGEKLQGLLANARQNALRLIENIREMSERANAFANAMDFGFLLDQQRLLMSVGYDAETKELQPYCYGLLATEPRTAVFIAIAKEDIPQECWFRLDRPVTGDHGRVILLSWTGTMFEYLMPSIWMRSYANTLLDQASITAVREQKTYGDENGIPWGISESACAKRNEAGDYHYEAFGVPNLALKRNGSGTAIVSPYSTFLALSVDPENALANLNRMHSLGWFGPYGFYEAGDYTNSRNLFGSARCEIVRSWMAHHLGMSLLSLANVLCDEVVRRWFHSDQRVQATELLLQEKPLSQA